MTDQHKHYFAQLRATQPSLELPIIEQLVKNSTNKCLKSLQTLKLKISETPKNQQPIIKAINNSSSISNIESSKEIKTYKSLKQLSKERRNREQRRNQRTDQLIEQMKAKEQELQEKQKLEKSKLHKQLHDSLQQKVHKFSQDSKNRLKTLEQEKTKQKTKTIPLYRQKLLQFTQQEQEVQRQKEQALQAKLSKQKLYDVQQVKTFEQEYEIKKNSLPKQKKNSFHYTPPKNRSHFYDIFAQQIYNDHNKTQSPNQSAIRYDPGKQIYLKIDPEKTYEMHQRLKKLELTSKEQIFPLMAHQNTYDFRSYKLKPKNSKEANKSNQVYERNRRNNAEVYELGKDYLSQARKVIKTEVSENKSTKIEIENANPHANFQKQLYELGRQYLGHQSKLISQKAREKHQYNEWEEIMNNNKLSDQEKKQAIELCIQRLEEQVKRKEKLKKAKGGQISLNENENQEIDKLLLTSIKAKLAML